MTKLLQNKDDPGKLLATTKVLLEESCLPPAKKLEVAVTLSSLFVSSGFPEETLQTAANCLFDAIGECADSFAGKEKLLLKKTNEVLANLRSFLNNKKVLLLVQRVFDSLGNHKELFERLAALFANALQEPSGLFADQTNFESLLVLFLASLKFVRKLPVGHEQQAVVVELLCLFLHSFAESVSEEELALMKQRGVFAVSLLVVVSELEKRKVLARTLPFAVFSETVLSIAETDSAAAVRCVLSLFRETGLSEHAFSLVQTVLRESSAEQKLESLADFVYLLSEEEIGVENTEMFVQKLKTVVDGFSTRKLRATGLCLLSFLGTNKKVLLESAFHVATRIIKVEERLETLIFVMRFLNDQLDKEEGLEGLLNKVVEETKEILEEFKDEEDSVIHLKEAKALLSLIG